MSDQNGPEFFFRMLSMYVCKKDDELLFTNFNGFKNNEAYTAPYLIQEKEKKNESFLSMLHPQVKNFLSSSGDYSAAVFELAGPLHDDLNRAIWRAKAPKWAAEKIETILDKETDGFYFRFKISGVEAVRFPTGILALYICVNPCFKIPGENIETAAKMMVNTLNRSCSTSLKNKFKPVFIERFFEDKRQKESIEKRLDKSKTAGLVDGLLGEKISIGDIMEGFLTENSETLMGDRFLCFSFLKSGWNNQETIFTTENYLDLVRLSRGESDYYHPYKNDCIPGNRIISTFENVVFAHSVEGVACWVKPDEKQEYLEHQFKQKYTTLYWNLYLLVLHQKYAMVHMAERLDREAPTANVIKELEKFEKMEEIKKSSKNLRYLRMEVADFYLRAFFQQPTILTNPQEFYRSLQEELGVSHLLEELQHATLEADYIIGSIQEIKNKHSRERREQIELLLALVVEFTAIPYYLYSLLDHASHAPQLFSFPLLTAFLFTAGVMVITYCKFRKKETKKTRQIKNGEQNT